jgi:hypothetical protein
VTDPGEPAWPSAATPAPAPVERRRLDLKLVIPVLIGLVSVTGAVLAWRSSQSSEYATDKDRQAVAETVVVAQVDAGNEIVVHDARSRFADHLAAVTDADLLDQQADRARGNGDEAQARTLEDEAEEQRAVGRRVLEGGTAPVLLSDYIQGPTFDEGRLRDDLELASDSRNQVNPSQTVREANRLRNESQRLDGFLIAMVSAVFVLTLAQISARRALRIGLAGTGTAVWVVASVLAITGAS